MDGDQRRGERLRTRLSLFIADTARAKCDAREHTDPRRREEKRKLHVLVEYICGLLFLERKASGSPSVFTGRECSTVVCALVAAEHVPRLAGMCRKNSSTEDASLPLVCCPATSYSSSLRPNTLVA